MFDPSNFTTQKAKPLPVCLLLDVSLSMSGDKIENLNKAVKEMLVSFAEEEKMETEIMVSIITFGSKVTMYLPPTKASQVHWEDLQADGMTPMGAALNMAKDLIEDKEKIPSRAYRPTIVLVSDGQPNDSWEKPLEDFIDQGRSSKCDRMALAIGHDADEKVLDLFIKGTPLQLLYANNAAQLHEFFQRVTMSVTMRTRSKNPNEIPNICDENMGSATVSSKSNISESTKNNDSTEDKGYW